MKSLFVAFLLVAAVAAQESFLLKTAHERSKRSPTSSADDTCKASMIKCCENSAQCGEDCSSLIIDDVTRYDDFVKLSNDFIIRSYEYLFISTQFGSHLKDRPGFEKVLHGLSDSAWNKGIEMIKESSKRGVAHSFGSTSVGGVEIGDVNEVVAFAKAVEIEKQLLTKANEVHRHHSHASNNAQKAKEMGYDAAIAHYIQEEIIEEKTGTVRSLVGHTNDLKKLFKDGDAKTEIFSMALYLFDQYLQK